MKMIIAKELIFDYLAGKASALQKQRIDDWLREEKNEELFYKWVVEYELLHPEYVADVDQAVGRYHQLLAVHESTRTLPPAEVKVVTFGRRFGWGWSIAATVLLLLVASAWGLRDAWRYRTYATAYGETRSVDLPDGSSVTLNANSSLRIPRFGFNEHTRRVYLKGEALFSVRHTQTHQKFIVQTDRNVEVEVLGTDFDVFARERGAKVVLNRGKVNVRYKEGRLDKQVMMKPGDLVLLDKQNHAQLKTTAQPEVHSAWRGNRYVFEQTTVQEVIYLLSEKYGIRAEVSNEALLAWTMSGSFTAENADELLRLMEEILDLKIVRSGSRVIISPAMP